jgi:hypothetical protein
MQRTFTEISLDLPESLTGTVSLRLFASDGASDKVLLIEPYTWQWLALNVAEGAIGGIAGELAIRALFGSSSEPIDFAKLIAQFVRLVEVVIKNALAEEAHRKLEVDLNSLKSLAASYQTGRNEELLTPLQINANRITWESVSLGLPSIPCFTVTGGIEMMVLREQLLRGKGSQLMLKQRAVELTLQAQEFAAKIPANVESRVKTRKIEQRVSSGGGYPQTRLYWLVTVDGVDVGPVQYSAQAIEPVRQQKISELRAQLERELINPIQLACQRWHQVADTPKPAGS